MKRVGRAISCWPWARSDSWRWLWRCCSWALNAGSLEFSALKSAGIGLGTGARWILFLLTFFGFGIKAGLVPFNTWLPRAHPAAPANVSAILSGVILNLGLYGIIRVNLDLVPVNMIGAGCRYAHRRNDFCVGGNPLRDHRE